MSAARSAKDAAAGPAAEERLRLLEAALEHAIDRFRTAKQVAKQAKDAAKFAKKDKKRARKALMQAQEEFGLHSAPGEAKAGSSDADDN